jgi:hypothetical protein
MQSAPKYSKIELFDTNGELLKTHEDCGMFITGEIFVIVEDSNDSVQNNQVSEGILYNMRDISRYKTYKV